jgi:NAD(P)-dependent dehydrogenase (short-subunit alcohol dehydrogenase family)
VAERSGRLAERVAVVTGGGLGIGRGVVRRFAAEGARVLIAGLDPAAWQEAADEVTASLGQCDDRWARTAEGWQLTRRRFVVAIELGDRTVLQPD